ncbi:MAG TPA: amino acid adenylation domain-containing protein, partial [Thermoanaerobaculia bacterium]
VHPIAIHHIIIDRVASYFFEGEVTEVYRALKSGRQPELPEPPIQMADFALWQRERLEDEVLVDELFAYWRDRLADAPELSTLPPDRPRPALQTPWGARRRIALPLQQAEAFRAFAQAQDVTMFIAGLAIWKALLVRLSGQEKFVIGTPMTYRQILDLPNVVGFFLNQIALYTDLSGDPTFQEVLARVRDTSLGAYAHQDLPFAKLVERLRPGRDLSRTPFTQVVFLLLDPPQGGWSAMQDVESRPYWLDAQRTQFDMTFALFWVEESGLTGLLEYNTDLFDAVTMDRVKEQFRMFLTAVLADPGLRLSELPLLSDAQRHQLLAEWGAVRVPAPAELTAETLHGRFAEQAALRPNAVAVLAGDEGAESLTYAELDRRADRLARRLVALGVRGDLVAIAAGRGVAMVAGILAILKAGCAYVAIDPSLPAERLAFLLADCGAPVLLADAAARASFPLFGGTTLALEEQVEERNGDLPPLPAGLDAADSAAPAYVIYTSGSTGKPKGVVVTHANVLRLFSATAPWFAFDERDVWTLFHSFAFDFSVWELWGALLHGGRVVVVPYWVSRSPDAFLTLLAEQRVTVLDQTPSAFRQLIPVATAAGAPELPALRAVIFGGEALDARALAPWVARFGDGADPRGGRGPALVNMYGITETTVHVTYHRVRAAEVESGWGSRIGVPIPDLSLHILDPYGQPMPIGTAGEICVGGAGVALGYLGRPELTAARFVPDPFSGVAGARLYRSGDLGRYLPAGGVEYLRRADHQVKVRGFRIELGEIEAALATHPQLAASVVVALPAAGSEDLRLVAYVVSRGDTAPTVEALRAHLAARLPEPLIPAVFVPLAALPLTANGKLDRRALPSPDALRAELQAEYEPPRSPAEELLAELWAELLGLPRVGRNDNFFSLGGDSIVSLRVVALAKKRGLSLTLQDIFRRQTIAAIACAAEPPRAAVDGTAAAAERSREPFALLDPAERLRLPEGVEDAYPLTQLQAGMLYHMALTAADPLYHNVGSYHLRGRFEEAPLREAVRRVTARHPMLRTAFDVSGAAEPLQLVYRHAEVPLEVEDWRALPEAEQHAAAARRIDFEKHRLFDLAVAPQMRLHIGLRGGETFQLTVTENHAIFDGWSLHSTLAEVFELYLQLLAGVNPAPLPLLASTFRDYVQLEHEAMASPEAAAFWSRALTEEPPGELPRWTAATEGVGGPSLATLSLPLAPALFGGLKAAARRIGVPVKSVLLAAHLRILGLLTGQAEAVTGLVTNGRLEELGGDQVRGLFLNTLPLRLALQGGSWSDLARAAFRAEEEILPHRRYPFAALQRQSERPLYEVAFNYVHFHVVRDLMATGGIEVLDVRMAEGASFRLMIGFSQSLDGERLSCELEYDTNELPAAQVEAIAGLYERTLTAIARDPEARYDGAALLSEAERHQLLVEWNDTARFVPGSAGVLAGSRLETVHGLVAARAAAEPAATAVAWEGGSLA